MTHTDPASSGQAASLAATMTAVVYERYGPPDVLEIRQVSTPAPGADEVLIRVRASAVNPADWFFLVGEPYMIRPLAGIRAPRNPILGRAVSGVVESIGPNVTDVELGAEVYAETQGGGFAQFTPAAADQVSAKPANLTFEQAATVPLVGVTALQGLRDAGKVGPGQKVLINGASGGVGTFAVQIAKWLGAEVTGVCSARNAELVRSLGADHVIDYAEEDFTTGGPRYDLILDNVGNHSVLECRRALVPKGTHLPNSGAGGRVLGGMTRVVASLVLSPFVSQTLKPFYSAGSREDLDTLRELIEDEVVTPFIDSVRPLTETAAALAHYGEGHTRGNIAIAV